MDKADRDEFRELISDVINPYITEIKSGNESFRTDIKRLSNQSAEHYGNYKELKEQMQNQVNNCQSQNNDSQEKVGQRLGSLEQTVARMDEHIKQNKDDINEIKTGSKWGKEMWIIIGVAAGAPFLAKLLEFV